MSTLGKEIKQVSRSLMVSTSFQEAIVSSALSWVGTPYHHQARLKGVGVDCANLIAAIGEEAGLVHDIVIEPYNLHWHLHSKEETMLNLLASYGCKPIKFDKAKQETWPIGSIITFQFGRAQSHLGIVMPDGKLVHAAADYKQVVHTHFSDFLLNRVGHLYTYPGLQHVKNSSRVRHH